MMGTLASVLATKKIRTHTDRFRAEVEGHIREVGGILKVTDIRVRYHLKVSAGQEADARWGFENYIEKCPAAQSVIGCIRIEDELELVHG
jgi:organic hydroperoxide reductase OsmC/OhrA